MCSSTKSLDQYHAFYIVIDGERFYSRNEFTSEEDLKKKLKRYNARYNNIAKKVLDFKSPNQIVEEYKLNFLSA